MLKELKEDVEKVKKTMHEQNGNINKETERKKKKFWSCKAHWLTWKWLEGFKGRFEQAEERISELEDWPIEIIQSEEKRKKMENKSP